ncbi:DUF4433 domain-containing protein [Mycobacterium sp. NPDC050853]|uniref:DUF4433 domain-containing protein n=1 Tax=Mycobacterium sp. NPDC050853 TaxID=3155160 RepID=UPI0033DFF30E
MAMMLFPDSGFMGRNGAPCREAPRDWIVWHFTHIDNLAGIIGQAALLPDSMITPATTVANEEVKHRRRFNLVMPHKDYPPAMVSAHVPFYIAAKSPMLLVVCSGRGEYKGGHGPLVHLGLALGDIIDAGLTWCASDGNAAAQFTQYSCDIETLGQFVDFELLCQRDWFNTDDDRNRQSRRSAEILVQGPFPINLIRHICCSNQQTLNAAHGLLQNVGGMRDYRVQPQMYYQ